MKQIETTSYLGTKFHLPSKYDTEANPLGSPCERHFEKWNKLKSFKNFVMK